MSKVWASLDGLGLAIALLLIITRSDDPAVDLVEGYLRSSHLRINVDESNTWSFNYNDGVWSVIQGEKVCVIDKSTKCWWWKAYLEDSDGDHYRNAEVEYMAREIYAEVGRVGKIVGNPPYFHQKLGKLAILDIARDFLNVPETNAVFNHPLKRMDDAIVKSFASETFSNFKVLYTTRVDLENLKTVSNPWFAQQFIQASQDITIYVVGDKLFTFRRDRIPGKTIDWRKEQLEDINRDAWELDPLAEYESTAIQGFLRALGVEWGRLDLLRHKDGTLWFLEFNANGQFGFLDEIDRAGLISGIARYLG
jgi:hypothetical protein